jgi:hypothetical protein
MSEQRPAQLMISTRNVAADGTSIAPGGQHGPAELSEAAARDVLQAFARVSPVDLVDIDARIYLIGSRCKAAVQNIGGRLFVTLVPESVNTAVELSPEQAIAWVVSGNREAVPESGAGAWSSAPEMAPSAPREASGWHGAMNSPVTLGVLVAVAGIMAYVGFWSGGPEGVELIRDAAKVSELHAKLNGRYGLPGATMLALAGGKLTGLQVNALGGAEEKRFAMDYRLGRRGDQVVLVLSNGAVLELQANGALKFLASSYPRAAN